MPGGRKSKYNTHVAHRLEEVRQWRISGYTEQQIAGFLGVAYSTMMEYMHKYPEFLEVIKESKEKLIAKLEQTLFQEAMGINSKAEVIEEVWELNRRN